VKLPVLWSVHDNNFFHNDCTCGVFENEVASCVPKTSLFFDNIKIESIFQKM
jgi:hypothetical protein